MLTSETQLSLEVDEEAVVASLDANDGLLLRDASQAGTYRVMLRPRPDAGSPYYVRVVWHTYPGAAPSVRFTEGISERWDVQRAWPIIPGYRIGVWDICKPFTAEGYLAHPEWVTGPQAWRSAGNPFLWVVETLQYDLNNHCQGRHA